MKIRIVLVVCVSLGMLPACRRAAPERSEAELPIPVIAEPVRLGTVRGTVSATGVVSALPGATVTVVATQPARIAEITKNVGDAVKSGETLVRFEFPALGPQQAVNAAALKAADLRLRQATLHQGRIRSLFSRGAASQQEMDEADREVAAAEVELAAARDAVSATESLGQHTTIRAPFNGVVTERLHNPGDLVRSDEEDAILRLIDPKQVQVTAMLPIQDAKRIAIGATARAIAQDKGTPELLRLVARPEPEAGATAITVALTFDTATELAPGTQVAIEIDAEQRFNVPLVPAIAVLKDGNQPFVVVAVGNVAQHRAVITGLANGEQVEIASGLKAGELIITQGHSSLRDGAVITVTPP